MEARKCKNCGNPIPLQRRIDAKYCSTRCGWRYRNRLGSKEGQDDYLIDSNHQNEHGNNDKPSRDKIHPIVNKELFIGNLIKASVDGSNSTERMQLLPIKDLAIKLFCLLIGYNYLIVNTSSEACKITIKKYLSALIINFLVWGIIGYGFAKRYLHFELVGSIIAGAVMIVIVLQVDRLIILSIGKNWMAPLFRILIAVVMSMIGSMLIDQLIFSEDIEIQRIKTIHNDLNRLLTGRTNELVCQLDKIDSALYIKNMERTRLIDEITHKPFVQSSRSERKHLVMQYIDPNGIVRDTIIIRADNTLTDIPNPKIKLLPGIEDEIKSLNTEKSDNTNKINNIRQKLEEEVISKTGFLEEFQVLSSILFSSWITLTVWLMFFILFLFIELFVLIIKYFEFVNDYDRFISLQMEVRLKMLDDIKNEG